MEASTEVRRQVLEYVQGNPYTTETGLLQKYGQQGIGAVSALWELADEGCFSSR